MKNVDGTVENLKRHFGTILRDSTHSNLYDILKEIMQMLDKQEIVHNLETVISKLNSEQLGEIWKEIGEVEGANRRLKEIFKTKLESEEEHELVLTIDTLKEVDIVQDEIKNDIGNIINRFEDNNERQRVVNSLLKSNNIALVVNECFNTGMKLENAQRSFINQIVLLDKTIQDMKTKQVIYSILREVMSHENVKIEEVDFCGGGDSANVFKIGEFVWKFQEARKTDKLIYDPRILQPIVRRAVYDYENGIKNDKPSMYIEMSNIVNTKWYEELTEEEADEELYKVYKEMRVRGVICVDIKANNVGRLVKDNRVNYKIGRNDLEIEDETIDMYGRDNNEVVLKKGELVIFDTDYIYTEKEYEEMKKLGEFSEENLLCNIFERRYKEEEIMELER